MNKNQRAERPNFETNPFFKKRSEARLAIERGRWMNSKRTQELAIALLTGYMQLLESDEGTFLIGYDELEIPDWEQPVATRNIPDEWFPQGNNKPENYQDPRIDHEDYSNCYKAQEAYIRVIRADYWCSGKGVEYGHTDSGQPYVRMVIAPQKGKTMWYPLH